MSAIDVDVIPVMVRSVEGAVTVMMVELRVEVLFAITFNAVDEVFVFNLLVLIVGNVRILVLLVVVCVYFFGCKVCDCFIDV